MCQPVLTSSGSAPQDCVGFAAPLLAIDRIEVSGREGILTLSAIKKIDAKAPYLAGHFPNFAIFPGIFIIEGLRQAVAAALGEIDGLLPEIRTLRSVRFMAPLLPGDSMRLDATLVPSSDGISWEVEARCARNDGVTAARMKLEFCYGVPSGA